MTQIILIALWLLIFWFSWLQEFKIGRKIQRKLNRKPFNCPFCLSSWIGIILSITMVDATYMLIPVITSFYFKR